MQDKEKNLLAELTSQMSSEIKIPDELMKEAEQMQGLLLYYSYAIKEIRTKLEILNDELAFRTRRNPIESIESRVKKPASIIEKLRRKNYPVSVESIFENLHDVAGVRVICSFIEDIYDVADMFLKQDDITLVEIKDYIKNPKSNGYRSLHLIVKVPIFLSDRTLDMKVEVQIRTMAMDFWAALEHQANYKKGIQGIDGLIEELTECAEIINQTDRRMQDIYHKILQAKEK
ncbi:MAG: GTP pyrophosphokinase family protein [Lachnospiraceae bacterium]|nr:GTP pyrophosphokinase family protein [Lachnospiraceae bacterium]